MTPADDIREIWAAGGVVFRRQGDSGIEIILVGRPRERLWALPKGKPEDGESIEETALREVCEETGLEVSIVEGGPIGSIRYSYRLGDDSVRIDKVVHHYLMQPEGGDLSRHDAEYDLVEWCDALEACKRMTFSNERSIVERAIEALDGMEGAS